MAVVLIGNWIASNLKAEPFNLERVLMGTVAVTVAVFATVLTTRRGGRAK
jgi:hypothetical protein